MLRFGAFAPFLNRSFRLQWPADLLTSCAFEMETLILAWYVLVETNSVLMLTIYGALLYGGTLIAPMFGVASDRIGPGNLLALMRATYALVAVILMTLAFSRTLNPLAVLFLAGISGLVRPSDMGLRSTLIAHYMPPEQLIGALGIGRTTSDMARIAGALAGAGMVASFGMGPAYVAVTAFYLVSAARTWRAGRASFPCGPSPMAPAAPEIAIHSSPWRDLREGIVHIWNTPRLLALVWFAFLVNFAVFPLTNGLLPYVAREIYQIDQTGLGYLVASVSIGALVGSVVMTRSGIRFGLTRIMLVGSVIWHVLVLVFAQMEGVTGGVLALLACGIAQSITMVSHTVLLLRGSSERFRGRVTGVRMMAIYSLPLGLLIAGTVIPSIGFHATASLYAILGLVCTCIIAAKWHDALWRSAPTGDGT
jgi:predicted MFS family arabinose efflux permease